MRSTKWSRVSRSRSRATSLYDASNRDPYPRKGGQRGLTLALDMRIGELARAVGRSVDTIKRWEDQGLLMCPRDVRGRRVYNQAHVELCLRLADLSLLAQRRSERLKALADREPCQLSLLASPEAERIAG
ncbi:MerR family transcriptional regulator [bacterium]|nr:MAG: MerR family transcriptional regulator [bacterium]